MQLLREEPGRHSSLNWVAGWIKIEEEVVDPEVADRDVLHSGVLISNHDCSEIRDCHVFRNKEVPPELEKEVSVEDSRTRLDMLPNTEEVNLAKALYNIAQIYTPFGRIWGNGGAEN